MTAAIPVVDSTWYRRDGGVTTVTRIEQIHGKPNVAYETTYPGTDRWTVGVADLEYFLAHHTEDSR